MICMGKVGRPKGSESGMVIRGAASSGADAPVRRANSRGAEHSAVRRRGITYAAHTAGIKETVWIGV